MRPWRGSARHDAPCGPAADEHATRRDRRHAARQRRFEVTGVTFDSREVGAGRPVRRHAGHGRTTDIKFVDQAFAAGAAGALVSQPVDGPHVLVDDIAEGADRPRPSPSRERCGGDNRRRHRIGRQDQRPRKRSTPRSSAVRGGRVHRSVKSYNNHTGVPLSLARMPRDSRIRGARNGHEQPGRDRRADPAWSARTSRSSPRSPPAHIENLGSMEAIADAKGEIFEGLEPDGIAIVPNDTPHRDRLVSAARHHADRIITFGQWRRRRSRAPRRARSRRAAA